MYQGKYYLSIQDLMTLMGTNNPSTVYRQHKALRDAISPGKRNITIREFCKVEEHEFQEIWDILRPGQAY